MSASGSSQTLKGKTLLVTGASRGIGLAIALRAARDGANIVIAAKSDKPDPRLPGTIHTAAQEVVAAGGRALAIATDIRDEAQVDAAVAAAMETFGGIDIVVNNASAMFREPTLSTDMKRFDLLFDINVRGTYMVTRKCLPDLLQSANPHVLTIAPLLEIATLTRFAPFPAYMVSKINMSLFTMALADEFHGKVGFNALWPRLAIWTAAHRLVRGEAARPLTRRAEIMGDAAWHVLTQDARTFSGRFLLDDDVLRDAGVTDFTPYYHADGDPADMNHSVQVSHGLYET